MMLLLKKVTGPNEASLSSYWGTLCTCTYKGCNRTYFMSSLLTSTRLNGGLLAAGCDVLWGGCPMVTLPLERMASRVAASLCYATGLGPEMVVSSQQEYEVSLLPLPLSAWITAPLRYAAAGPEKGLCQGMLEGGHAFNTSC